MKTQPPRPCPFLAVRAGAVCAAVLVLTACPKKEEPAAVVAPAPAAKVALAEVEFMGKVAYKLPGVTKAIFVAMKEPCSPVPAEPQLFGHSEVTQEQLFAEFFPPQGTVAHLCVYGFDAAGQVVAAAAYAKNPVTIQGSGEVIFPALDLKLEPLATPTAAPKGL